MPTPAESLSLLTFIVDRINVGIFVVDAEMRIVLWNKFMEVNSRRTAADVQGKNLFSCFPELPAGWLEHKIRSVFILKNYAFTTWEQRPYLFKFPHNRPVTGGIDHMQQNCTFIPVKDDNGEVALVCITLFDVTDASLYEGMLKKAMASLAEASNRDGLTNLYNRRFFEDMLFKEFSRAQRYQSALSLVMLDIDHFKTINDTHGHQGGDQVLRCVANQLAQSVRNSDTLTRYGGEEFAVILPETPMDLAIVLAERIRENIQNLAITFNNTTIPVTISLGISQIRPEHVKYETLIKEADSALYLSKLQGRNRTTRFEPS